MDDPNPYAAPEAPLDYPLDQQTAAGDRPVTLVILRAMSQTRLWVLLFGALLLVGGAGVIVACPVLVVVSLVTGDSELLIAASVCIFYGLLYFVAGYYLSLYARRIRLLQQSRQMRDLESAIVAQKSFWKFVGVVLVAGTVLAGVIAGGLAILSRLGVIP